MAEIAYAAGYRVPPGKDKDEETTRNSIVGSELTLASSLRNRIEELIERTQQRSISIAFPAENQNHQIRDLVVDLARGRRRAEAGGDLSFRLSRVTDNRSRMGLLLVLVTSESRSRRSVHLLRFAADQSFVTEVLNNRLSIKMLDEAFAPESVLFKSARFTGNPSADTDFWDGLAEDRQAKLPGAAASAYWIEGFLQAELKVSPAQGTAVLAEALNRTLRRTSDMHVKNAIVSGSVALLNAAGDTITFREASQRLPASLREPFLRDVEKAYDRNESFVVDRGTLEHELGIRVLELDTGVVVQGPNEKFDRVVHREPATRDRTELRTTGVVVTERLKRGRST